MRIRIKLQNLVTATVLASLIYQPFYPLSAQERVVPALDISAPVIEHEPNNETQPMGQPLDFSIKVVDDSGVKNVTLFYRVIGADTFKRLNMVKKDKQGGYSTIIPADDMRSPGIEYYIQAADLAGNTVLRGFDFSPLKILVGSPGLEKAIASTPSEDLSAEVQKKEQKTGVMKWVLIGMGVAAAAGLGIALGGGGGGGGGGDNGAGKGSVDIGAEVPQ